MLADLRAVLRPGAKVLDAGCGDVPGEHVQGSDVVVSTWVIETVPDPMGR